MMNVTVNAEQRLFVIPQHGGGFCCLGFDVCWQRTMGIANELGRGDLVPKATNGTLDAYREYEQAVSAASLSGRRLKCELTPQLIGLEGRRVEIVDAYGERRRFWVGKSTGFIPVHLEIHNTRSTGGCAVSGAPFASVVVVREGRR